MITVRCAVHDKKLLVAEKFDFLHHVSSLSTKQQYLQIRCILSSPGKSELLQHYTTKPDICHNSWLKLYLCKKTTP